MTGKHICRRAFLAGLGAGLTLPVAAALAPRIAVAGTIRPQRFLIYFVPHGWPIEQVDTFGAGAGWLDGNLVLGGLARWQDQVRVLRGVSNLTGETHGGVHNILSGTDDARDSVDVTIAGALGTRPWLCGVVSGDYFSRANFEGGEYMREIGSPLDFLDQLYAPESDAAARELENRIRMEVLGLSERQLERYSSDLSAITREQSRLQTHIDAVREVKARYGMSLADPGSCGIDTLLTALAHLDGLDVDDLTNTTPLLDGHIQAVGASLVCGAARVATIRNHGSGHNYTSDFPDGPGIDGNAHMNSHNGNADHRLSHYGANLRWFLDRLAVLLDILDVPDPLDPAHTVLENTTVLYTSEMCDGSHVATAKEISVAGGTHYTYLPMVVIGGGGGALGPAGVIQAETGHEDVLQTLAAAHGATRASGDIISGLLA